MSLFLHRKRFGKKIALHHLLISESSAVNGCLRMRVQTANKNIKTAHTTPVHQHLVTWKAACLYETNPSLRHFNFKSSLLAKKHSIIHYNIPSSEKVHSLLSTHIKIHQHFCLKLLMNILDLCIFIFWFNKMICFSLMKAILWIEKRFVKSILEDFFTLHSIR